uniref:Uncharacterized protein n=1 Tax=Lotharella globosa TaxID=91324 RepID=A0A7S4DZR0_9EUKA
MIHKHLHTISQSRPFLEQRNSTFVAAALFRTPTPKKGLRGAKSFATDSCACWRRPSLLEAVLEVRTDVVRLPIANADSLGIQTSFHNQNRICPSDVIHFQVAMGGGLVVDKVLYFWIPTDFSLTHLQASILELALVCEQLKIG